MRAGCLLKILLPPRRATGRPLLDFGSDTMTEETVECSLWGGSVVVDDRTVKQLASNSPDRKGLSSVDCDLSWRLDPLDSLSDWTLLIRSPGAPKMEQYDIHKSVVGVGPRRSILLAEAFQKYKVVPEGPIVLSPTSALSCLTKENDVLFLREFLEDSYGMGTTSREPSTMFEEEEILTRAVTILELEPRAAAVVPEVLDFLYPPHKWDFTQDQATAAHLVAKVLNMPYLQQRLVEFVEVDWDNLGMFYGHARELGHDAFLPLAAKCLAQNMSERSEDDIVAVFHEIDVDFFYLVVEAMRCDSLRKSLWIAIYANIHSHNLTKEEWEKITSDKYIPTIDLEAAQLLLDIEFEIVDKCSATSLKQRCIDVVAPSWREIYQSDANVVLPSLQGDALALFAMAALNCAAQQLGNLELKQNEEKIRNSEAKEESPHACFGH